MRTCAAVVGVLVAMLLHPGCGASRNVSGVHDGFVLADLLGRMPPRDTLEARWLGASLVRLGPDAVGELCDMLDTAGSTRTGRAEYALQALALHVSRPGAEPERLAYVSALARALGRQRPPRATAFLLARVQMTGKEESIDAVSRFLRDPQLCAPAAQAMVTIREGAEEAFLSALSGAGPECRRTIVQGLGELQSAMAVDPLLRETASDDQEIRRAALSALANIGDTRGGSVLARAVAGASARDRNEYCAFWLLFARRRLEAGDTAAATAIGRELLAGPSPGGNDPVRPAALGILVRTLGEAAFDDLLETMADTSRQTRRAALDLASGIGGSTFTASWVEVAKSERPEVRAEVLSMLGRRGDTSASSAVLEALRDPDLAVRGAAAEASVRLGGSHAVTPLLELLGRSDEAVDIAAVRNALELLPAGDIVPFALESLPRLTPAASVMLLDLLGRDRASVPGGPIAAVAKSGRGPVRIAALRTLGLIGEESSEKDLIGIVLSSEDGDVRDVARRSLVSVCARRPDPEKRAEALLDAYAGGNREERRLLLPVIGRVGGKGALALVSSEVRNRSSDLRDEAVRSLAEWPTIDAFDTLLSAAKRTEKLNLRVVALRGCVRVVENDTITPDVAVRYHERTLMAAERMEEKRLVIGALANLHTAYALKVVAPYVRDDSLGLDAALAAGRISGGMAVPAGELGSKQVARAFIDAYVPSKFRREVDRALDASAEANYPPPGFRALFDGRTLDGWKGLVGDPLARSRLSPAQHADAQIRADSVMRAHWSAADGVLLFDGKGENLCTVEEFENFELLVDWKIDPLGDSGIYLRGSPQVQIWDPSIWAEGSGGLYNNQMNPNKPLRNADRPAGEWNTFRIRMVGERVTVYLNAVLVVDSVILENYWNRAIPIFPTGQIELQSHNTPLAFRNIFIRELPKRKQLFAGNLLNGVDLTGWVVVGGDAGSWGVRDGVLSTTGEGGGWLSTDREYDNFELDLDFRVQESGNSGVFLRAPREGDPAYTGMEIQVLDDYSEEYASLRPWQYCGSLYGVVPAARGASRKANEWQHCRIVACGPRVTVSLNGLPVVDADLVAHMDQESSHPGLKRRSGYIGLQCHGGRIEYRNIVLRELEWRETNDGD